MTAQPDPLALDQALAHATRRRNRLTGVTAIALLLACLFAPLSGMIGTDLPAGTPYTWNSGTVFVHSADATGTCTMTTGNNTEQIEVARDSDSWVGVSGVDLTTEQPSTIVCTHDVTVTAGAARITTYPARHAWILAIVAAALGGLMMLAVVQVAALQRAQATGPWRRL